MAQTKPQYLKTLNTINAQPEKLNSRAHKIIHLDLCGYTNKEIAEITGMTEGRVSIIKNCPLYKQQYEEERKKIADKVVDKESTKIVEGEAVDQIFKEAEIAAAKEKVRLALEADSEFVRNTATSEVLGYRGYKARGTKTVTSIEIDSKVAERWDRVLNDKPDKPEGTHTVRITEEMSE
jgi:transcriptional regulator